MALYDIRRIQIAKRNVKDIPNILKILEKTKKDLHKYQWSMYVELIIESIDEALEELGYSYLKSQEVLKDKGKV